MKPIKNKQYEINITDVTAKGFGVGSVNNFTIFVDGALPGDRLTVHIVKVNKRYGYGKIIDILTPSTNRIPSPCPVFDRCGGCQFQHYEYAQQLKLKKRIVTETLQRIGGIKAPNVLDTIGMDEPTRYRNKAVFPVVPSDNKNGFSIGMYAARSHRIIEVNNCLIQHPIHTAVLKTMQEHIITHKITPYNESTHKGLMRHITIRTSLATNEVMVILTINGSELPAEDELCKKLTLTGATTIILSTNKAKNNAILGPVFRTLYGTGYITEQLSTIEYMLSAPSFFQVNPVQTEKLYETALNQAELTGTETIIDAHVGVGGITLYAAKKAKNIIGIDIVEAAINDAQKNAELNGIKNTKFICAAAEEIIPKMLTQNTNETHPSVIFLDPPRKGCERELLDAIIKAKIKKIVYISCDPATLARDVKILTQGGYNLIVAQPVDMFPKTGKVETSVLLQ